MVANATPSLARQPPRRSTAVGRNNLVPNSSKIRCVLLCYLTLALSFPSLLFFTHDSAAACFPEIRFAGGNGAAAAVATEEEQAAAARRVDSPYFEEDNDVEVVASSSSSVEGEMYGSGDMSSGEEERQEGCPLPLCKTWADFDAIVGTSHANGDSTPVGEPCHKDEASVEYEQLELLMVLPPDHVRSEPICCSNLLCKRSAFCVLASKDDPETPWFSCFGCQQTDFGGPLFQSQRVSHLMVLQEMFPMSPPPVGHLPELEWRRGRCD